MIIQNTTNHKISFKGYDARRLHGFIMNSSVEGVAEQLQKIGELENFRIFLLESQHNGCVLRTDKFNEAQEISDIWTQDTWSIIKDTLLFNAPSEYTEALMKIFRLKPNPKQVQLQKLYNLKKIQNYIKYLMGLPRTTINGELVVRMENNKGSTFVKESVIGTEIHEAGELYEHAIFSSHIKGGNFFITRTPDGRDEVLVGADDLRIKSLKDLKKIFKNSQVHIMPQADYHLDLFIRPLTGKKVLVADDRMMIDVLKQQRAKLKELADKSADAELTTYTDLHKKLSSFIEEYERGIDTQFYAKTDEVVTALKQAGYTPIRVPGRICRLENGTTTDVFRPVTLRNLHNYINAQVIINDKGELVYLTNKSTFENNLGLTDDILQKIGISLEGAFLAATKPYIQKVYFISGKNNIIGNELLPNCFGGIHCFTTEVPKQYIQRINI